MNPALAALLAFLAACVTGGVTWGLGRRKSDADADHVVVGTADKLVTLLRADMEAVRADMIRMRAEIDQLHVHVQTCEHDNASLRTQIAALKVENAGLRARVDDLEADLRHRTDHPRPD